MHEQHRGEALDVGEAFGEHPDQIGGGDPHYFGNALRGCAGPAGRQ
jgi:hypothetical protein